MTPRTVHLLPEGTGMTPRTVHLLPETEERIRELLPLYKLENEPWASARDTIINIAVRRLWNEENPRTHEDAHARAEATREARLDRLMKGPRPISGSNT